MSESKLPSVQELQDVEKYCDSFMEKLDSQGHAEAGLILLIQEELKKSPHIINHTNYAQRKLSEAKSKRLGPIREYKRRFLLALMLKQLMDMDVAQAYAQFTKVWQSAEDFIEALRWPAHVNHREDLCHTLLTTYACQVIGKIARNLKDHEMYVTQMFHFFIGTERPNQKSPIDLGNELYRWIDPIHRRQLENYFSFWFHYEVASDDTIQEILLNSDLVTNIERVRDLAHIPSERETITQAEAAERYDYSIPTLSTKTNNGDLIKGTHFCRGKRRTVLYYVVECDMKWADRMKV